MVGQWLFSRTVRHATDLAMRVRRLLNEQRDLLSPEAIESIAAAIRELKASIISRADKTAILSQADQLVAAADRWLLPFPHATARENVKELLVAGTVILAFTTFFLQLTKIPTGSMQPTLYGITHENLRDSSDFQMTSRLRRWAQYWIRGIAYYHITAKNDGELIAVEAPKTIFPFVKKQRILVGEKWDTIWFPPDDLPRLADLQPRMPWREGQAFRKGDDIVRLKVVSGDHLLVDRFTYNFRRPQRGEIIVFKTKGIPGLWHQDQLYIKRLVALGGERVQIGNDQHLIIDGRRLDAATPHFENVYTFSPSARENEYFGHVNQWVANRRQLGSLAPLFPDETVAHAVAPGHFLGFGDNTRNSSDSRTWGDLPQENVIGKCWFVYWPFTGRFGWSVR